MGERGGWNGDGDVQKDKEEEENEEGSFSNPSREGKRFCSHNANMERKVYT